MTNWTLSSYRPFASECKRGRLKKTQPIILPPLSVETLANIEIAERATAKKIKECAGFDFDLTKAIRHVKAFAVAVFDWQLGYYRTLPQFHSDWSLAILEETTTILMNAIPHGTQSLLSADKTKIRKEIQATLGRHILAMTSKQNTHPVAATFSVAFDPFSPRLDKAVAVLGIRHDEMARRMGIPKTTYFAVKRGDGKTSTKFKMDAYLKNLNKSNPDTAL
jgi:hypothetical protein